jgi:electron transfer flavoprotein alpha/beta subunit
VLTINQEHRTIIKPMTVLVSIFFPIVLAVSEPPNIKIKPAITAIIAAAIGVIVKTRKFITLTNPTNKSQGLQSSPLQGTSPAAKTGATKNIKDKKIIKEIKCLYLNIKKRNELTA